MQTLMEEVSLIVLFPVFQARDDAYYTHTGLFYFYPVGITVMYAICHNMVCILCCDYQYSSTYLSGRALSVGVQTGLTLPLCTTILTYSLY